MAGDAFAAQSALVGEGEGELVRFRAAIVDSSGNELSTIPAGGSFTLRVFVDDLRTADPTPATSEDGRGVFSAFTDVAYTGPLANFVGPITFSSDYQGLTFPGTRQPGLLNEVGAVQTSFLTPLGPNEKLLFSAAFTASNSAAVQTTADTFSVSAGASNVELDVLANDAASGILSFTPNPADDTGSDVFFLEPTADPIADDEILFVGDSVQVTGLGTTTITAAGGASGQTPHGTVTIVGGKLRYTPAAGFIGTDTFNYTVQNGSNTAQGQVTVTVAAAVDKVKFAMDLAAAGVKFFGADWCPFCTTQKQLFEDGQHFLPFIEVTNPDRSINSVGQANNISTFPTWDIPDPDNEGETIRRTGVLTLQELSDLSGVELTNGTNPFLVPIENVTLLTGAPLHIPLDGYDPNGSKLTYTVNVTGASGVTAQVLAPSTSLKLDMAGFGDMIFRLFDNDVSRVADAIAALAEDGTYDDTIFHRVIDSFVIQGGDPTGTGFGDPALPDFDDQFHFDLQHTQSGLLSMAKAGDDTNSSQFFVTELVEISDADKTALSQPTIDVNSIADADVRNEFQNNPSLKARVEALPAAMRILFMQQIKLRRLDFNHSVFGVLVEGEDVRQGISRTATGAQDRPSNNVRITAADLITDEENGVLRLKAAATATGTAMVTVTATDQEGKSTTRTFSVNVAADPFNGGPFLNDIAPVRTAMNTAGSFQLQGRDVENDPVTYTATLPSGATNFTFNVNPATGLVSYTPPQNFVGTLSLNVGVRPQGTSDTGDLADTQLVSIEVGSEAPTGVDLLAASDTGTLSDDNNTNANSLQFQVNGVRSGATVQLFRGSTMVGSVVATGTTASITVSTLSQLPEGAHQFTAKQVVSGATSNASPATAVTIDRTAPAAMTSTPPTEASVGNLFTYNAQNAEEGNAGFVYGLVNSPNGMTINQTTGVVSWTPAASQSGQNTFSVRARDAAGNQRDQSITLNVITGPAASDQYSIRPGRTLTVNAADGVLKNDDPTNQLGTGAKTATKLTDPQNGTLTFNADGSFTYTPQASFAGTDSFTYRMSRGAAQSNVATVTITVMNNAPVAANDTYTTPEDQPLTVTVANDLLTNDTDADGDTLVALIVTNPIASQGTISNFNGQNGTFTFTPAANFTGAVTFTYRVNDGAGSGSQNSNVATVTINVTGQNDAPTLQAVSFNSFKNAPETFFPLSDFASRITDPDGAGQTFKVVSVTGPSQQGSVRVAPDGSGFFYRPRADFNGTETFSIKIADQANAESNTATATVTVREFQPGSLAGFVYLDSDGDGVMEDGDARVAGVTLTLTGTTSTGAAVASRTAVTKADGSYKFEDLLPGTYTVAETQPALLVDGLEDVGSQGGTSSTNDQIVITLAEAVNGTGNNFGEMRAAATYSILDFLSVKPLGSVLVAANSTADTSPYYIVESGWDNLADLDARLSTDGASATINIEEGAGAKLRATNVTQIQTLSTSTTPALSLVRIFGNRNSFTFQPVTSSAATQSATADETETEGEGEAEDSALTSQFDVSGDASILDFLYTADVTPETATPPAGETPQLADAVDAVFTELGDDEAAPTDDIAAASLTGDDDFEDAVDLVFEQGV